MLSTSLVVVVAAIAVPLDPPPAREPAGIAGPLVAQEEAPSPTARPPANRGHAPGHAAPPGAQAAPPVDDGRALNGFAQHFGATLALGALPAAAASFLLMVPYGVFAAPLLAFLPLVGALVAVPITNIMNGEAGGFFGATVGWVMSAIPLYLSLGLVAAVPVVDALSRGASLDVAEPALTMPAAGVLAGAGLVAGTVVSLFTSLGYAAEIANGE